MTPRPAVMLAIFLFGVSSLLVGQEAAIKDDTGDWFTPGPSPPRRIVSLAPNITEILFALGLGDRVVGVTRFCDYPGAALAKEKVGGLVDPSIEKIKSLEPDLVIGFRGNPLRILDRLKSLEIPVFILDIGKDMESLYPLIEKIGRVTLAENRAGELVRALRAKQAAIRESLKNVPRKPRVFLILHGMGLWTCGRDSYLNDLLVQAQALNITGQAPKKWLHYNREQVIKEDPEAILILAKSSSEFSRAREWLISESRLDKTSAVRGNRIYWLDENVASRFGPRLIDALAQAACALHPGRLGME
ncbi:MAG: helical backbone metal receptor [Acidobacteriota bacterium]|nr:helical backbone metal receptor [Acidobacteriota bacterium]